MSFYRTTFDNCHFRMSFYRTTCEIKQLPNVVLSNDIRTSCFTHSFYLFFLLCLPLRIYVFMKIFRIFICFAYPSPRCNGWHCLEKSCPVRMSFHRTTFENYFFRMSFYRTTCEKSNLEMSFYRATCEQDGFFSKKCHPLHRGEGYTKYIKIRKSS